jgi:hypothetical protein
MEDELSSESVLLSINEINKIHSSIVIFVDWSNQKVSIFVHTYAEKDRTAFILFAHELTISWPSCSGTGWPAQY